MPLIWYEVSLVADRTGEWIYLSLSLRDRFYLCLCCATPQMQGGSWCPVVGESDPIHKPERKVNGCLGTTRRCSRRVCYVCLAMLRNSIRIVCFSQFGTA